MPPPPETQSTAWYAKLTCATCARESSSKSPLLTIWSKLNAPDVIRHSSKNFLQWVWHQMPQIHPLPDKMSHKLNRTSPRPAWTDPHQFSLTIKRDRRSKAEETRLISLLHFLGLVEFSVRDGKNPHHLRIPNLNKPDRDLPLITDILSEADASYLDPMVTRPSLRRSLIMALCCKGLLHT